MQLGNHLPDALNKAFHEAFAHISERLIVNEVSPCGAAIKTRQFRPFPVHIRLKIIEFLDDLFLNPVLQLLKFRSDLMKVFIQRIVPGLGDPMNAGPCGVLT